jgi:hypothetical protein
MELHSQIGIGFVKGDNHHFLFGYADKIAPMQAKTEHSDVHFRTGEYENGGFVVIEPQRTGLTAIEDAFLGFQLYDDSVANVDAVSAYLREHVKGISMTAFPNNLSFPKMRG